MALRIFQLAVIVQRDLFPIGILQSLLNALFVEVGILQRIPVRLFLRRPGALLLHILLVLVVLGLQ